MPEDRIISVLVVDDHKLFRDGLAALLADAPGVDVVGQAGTGLEAIDLVTEVSPEVILMDITMPEMNGIDATRQITAEHPEVHVVMLTMLEDDDSLFAAMCAGAHGYVLKGADKADVLRAIRAVSRGEALFGPAMAQRLTAFFQQVDKKGLSPAPFPELTEREREVLDLIASGLDNQAIATKLFISRKTVSNNISNIFAKLHLADRSQAIVTAREAGLGRSTNRS